MTHGGGSDVTSNRVDTDGNAPSVGTANPATITVSQLPEPNWGDDRVLAAPWEVVCDALIYQQAGAPLPEELTEAAEYAAMVLTSLALIRSGQYDIDDMDDLWDRDLEWRFTWAEADESLTVMAVFGDGDEPASVRTTARGLDGRLNEFMLAHRVVSGANAPTDSDPLRAESPDAP